MTEPDSSAKPDDEVDDSEPDSSPATENTEHPVGAEQARRNADDELPG